MSKKKKTHDRQPSHSVYVVGLDIAILEETNFVKANPNHVPGKPCFYVGMTGKSPVERFKQHKSG
jgi:hypothetical protein